MSAVRDRLREFERRASESASPPPTPRRSAAKKAAAVVDNGLFKKELKKDLQMGLAIALAVAVMQIVDTTNPLRLLGYRLPPVAYSVINGISAVFVGAFMRMIINDAAPPTARRQEMKGFLSMLLMMVAAFLLKAGVGPLNAYALDISGVTSYSACTCVHVAIAMLAGTVAHFSAFLPTSPPPQRVKWYSIEFRTYGLHLCALWNAALGLPLGYAWNEIKNDLLALVPLPMAPTAGRVVVMLAINLLLVFVLAFFKCPAPCVATAPAALPRLGST